VQSADESEALRGFQTGRPAVEALKKSCPGRLHTIAESQSLSITEAAILSVRVFAHDYWPHLTTTE